MSKLRPTVKELAERKLRAERTMRIIATIGAVPVGLVGLWVSYGHIYDVTLNAGESQSTAAIMALSVDGLMIVSGISIVSGRKSFMPYLAFTLGMLASLAANVVSADPSGLSYVVAGWPAVSLTVTSELLLRMWAPARRKPKPRARASQVNAKPRSRRVGTSVPSHALNGSQPVVVATR